MTFLFFALSNPVVRHTDQMTNFAYLIFYNRICLSYQIDLVPKEKEGETCTMNCM